MDVLLIVFLTLLNGLFAMSEMALASSRKARLAVLAESGDGGAYAALLLLEQPSHPKVHVTLLDSIPDRYTS